MHNERVEADEKKGKGNIQWIDHNLELFFYGLMKWFNENDARTSIKQKDSLKAKVNMTIQQPDRFAPNSHFSKPVCSE